MPIIEFDGQRLRIDQVYSYARVSSPQQTEERGGEGIQRQVERTREFCARYGLPFVEYVDLGKSGSKGHNIRKGQVVGALGLFLEAIKAGEIPPYSALTCESFSRLGRLESLDSLDVFRAILNNPDTYLITLQDRQIYSRDILRRDPGKLHTVVAHMNSARMEAESKGDYSHKAWNKIGGRRTRATNVIPSWIVRPLDKHGLPNPDADTSIKPINGLLPHRTLAPLVRRIFKMALTMGAARIATLLNAENVPTFTERKRRRAKIIWDKSTITKLIRGQQALGLQTIGHYENGNRVLTGETVQAYPAVISREEWLAVQAETDDRSTHGARTGRNSENLGNLFGSIAVCGACGERMKMRYRGVGLNKHAYLSCSVAFNGACSQSATMRGKMVRRAKFFRVDRAEADVFALFTGLAWDDPPDEKASAVTAQLATARKEATKLQNGLAKLVMADGDAKVIGDISRQHKARLADVTKLERQLAATKRTKPASDHLTFMQGIGERLQRLQDSELADARGKIASALPALLTRLAFDPSGRITATLITGKAIVLGDWQGVASPSGFIAVKPAKRRGPDVAIIPYKHPAPHRETLRRQPPAVDIEVTGDGQKLVMLDVSITSRDAA